jgi:hypothetical protein
MGELLNGRVRDRSGTDRTARSQNVWRFRDQGEGMIVQEPVEARITSRRRWSGRGE